MGVGTIGALNDAVSAGRIQEIILIQEALMEQKIGQLAEQIKEGHHKKFIMIAGPSSSGKTTFFPQAVHTACRPWHETASGSAG